MLRIPRVLPLETDVLVSGSISIKINPTQTYKFSTKKVEFLFFRENRIFFELFVSSCDFTWNFYVFALEIFTEIDPFRFKKSKFPTEKVEFHFFLRKS